MVFRDGIFVKMNRKHADSGSSVTGRGDHVPNRHSNFIFFAQGVAW